MKEKSRRRALGSGGSEKYDIRVFCDVRRHGLIVYVGLATKK